MLQIPITLIIADYNHLDTDDARALPDPVIIEDYDPRWPRIFEMLRSRIAAILDHVAISIEHVGSTAVPGLAAKPVIDIDVLLRSANDLPLVIRTTYRISELS